MMAEPVLRVLVSKKELDSLREQVNNLKAEIKTLRDFHGSQNSSSKVTLDKDGEGCSDDPCDPCADKDPCHCKDSSDNQENNLIQFIQQKAPRVEMPPDEEVSNPKLPITIILSQLWKRNQYRARTLLLHLEKSGHFTWDQFGVAKIDDQNVGSVFDLMKATFQSSKSDKVNLDLYIQLLTTLGLLNYVSNKSILMKDDKNLAESKYWYYVGN